MGEIDGNYKAVMPMVVLQCITAGVTLVSKVALSHGMSPLIFVVYRQAFATIVMAPLAVTANNNIYFEGLKLSSSAIATAMLNLIPAITILMATVVGQLEAMSFFIQVWCISQTGPVLFTPLSTVIATIIAILFLNQNLYIGSLMPDEQEKIRRVLRMFRPEIAVRVDNGVHPATTAAKCYKGAL
ncbi:hypothetical protein L484_023011 [Morus notabilis]|uniref:WAT1-related protein n=1 Tax=Morus notabilis TaxID=981085 RepID=W9RVT3_9ROSA|nr:hypothetical protein L484_023011 [Morus notabilis]